IAFASNRSAAYNLFVMSVSGGTPIRLVASPHDERYPAWSADGNKILYSEDSGDATKLLDLRSVDASGLSSSISVLASNDGDDIEAALSPDGARADWASNGTIWEGAAPGATDALQKLYPAGGQSSPTWAPTSDRWAFVHAGTIVVQDASGYSYTD